MIIRRIFVRLHRWAGLASALFLAVAGLTGAPLVFYWEIDELLNPSLFRDTTTGGRMSVLSGQELVDRIERRMPDVRVLYINLRWQPGRNLEVIVVPRGQGQQGRAHEPGFNRVFISPVTGEIAGTRDWGAIAFDAPHIMPFIYRLHYTLHIVDPWGIVLMGVVAIVWLLDSFVGLYLTLPTAIAAIMGQSYWVRWKPAWLLKKGAGRFRFLFDVHRAGGLWFWIASVALAVSSVALNLHNEVFRPVVGLFAPMTPHPVARAVKLATPNMNPPIDHDGAVRFAVAQLPLRSRDLTVSYVGYGPEYGIYRVGFDHPDRASALFRIRYQHVYIDAVTGSAVAYYGTDTGTAGDAFAAMQFPIHSGQILGLAGRIIVCASGIVITILCVTGIYVWWRKRRARRGGRQQASTEGV